MKKLLLTTIVLFTLFIMACQPIQPSVEPEKESPTIVTLPQPPKPLGSVKTNELTGAYHLPLSAFGAEGVALWAADPTNATTPATFTAEAGVLLADGSISPSLGVGVEDLTIKAANPTGKNLIVYENAYISDATTTPMTWKAVKLTGTAKTFTIAGRTVPLTGFLDAAAGPVNVTVLAAEIPFTPGDDNFVAVFLCDEVTAGAEYACNGAAANAGPWVLHEIKGFVLPTAPATLG